MPPLEVLRGCARRRAASSGGGQEASSTSSEIKGTVTCHARESGHPERPRQSLDSRVRGIDTLTEFEALENTDLIVD